MKLETKTKASTLVAVVLSAAAVGCGGIHLMGQRPADARRAQACVETALRRHPDPTVLADAVKHFGDACRDGDAGGCSTLGVMAELGRAVPQDEARAAALYLRACEADNALGCVNLGRLYQQGRGVEQSYSKAIELYSMGCRTNAMQGCSALGKMYAQGSGVEVNGQRAASFYQRACDRGDADSCFALGNLYRDGHLRPDTVATIELYERACTGGVLAGCDRLAETYRLSRPAARPIPTHPKRDACELGDATACAAVGMAYFNGDQVPRDVARATAYLQRACQGGYQPSCSVLAPMLQGACTRGDAQSCQALGRLAAR